MQITTQDFILIQIWILDANLGLVVLKKKKKDNGEFFLISDFLVTNLY